MEKEAKSRLEVKQLDISKLSMKNKNQDILTIHFSKEENDWVIFDKEPVVADPVEKLTVLTYNIWYQDHHFIERMTEIKKIIQNVNPDIICLQEVTSRAQNFFSQDKTFSQAFYISGNKISNYGCLVMSKFPLKFQLVELDSEMHRALLIGRTEVNGQQLTVATCHLESLVANKDKRGEQLKIIQENVGLENQVLLMGDFNFDSKEEQEKLDVQFVDQWAAAKGEGEEGNTMFITKDGKKAWRPDRIFLKSDKQQWKAGELGLVGKESIPYYSSNKPENEDEITTPSDHLGIYANFSFTKQ